MKMSAASSLTYNYDKDSFEEGTFEDISELSLEEVEGDEESEFDENYAMEIERTRIIIPTYSANNKANLKTLIEEQKNDEEKSDTEQEDEKYTNKKNEIEEISRSDEDDLNNSTTIDDSDNENNEEEDDNEDNILTEDHNNDKKNQLNNDNSDNDEEDDDNNSDDDNNNSDDSDNIDVELEKYKKLLEKTKNEENNILNNERSCDNTDDSEDNYDDIDKLDDEINQNIDNNNSIENIKDNNSSDYLLIGDDNKSDNEQEEEEGEEVEGEEEEEEEELNTTTGTSVELVISSQRPSSFNSDDNAYHLDFVKKSQTSLKSIGQTKSKNNVNRNLSFSNERLRDIERQNKILLQRILTKKPTYENLTTRNSNKNLHQARRITSAAINRKKQQHQIDLDNQILKRKLEAIALRRRAKQ